jgi:sterol desaturase/sphingolipid hydroxylase (fatty acid hydroxylase superfamily)
MMFDTAAPLAANDATAGRPLPWVVAYGLYPLLLVAAVAGPALAPTSGARSATAALVGLVSIVVMIVVERRWPLRREWSMTRRTFGRRDLPFLVSGLGLDRLCEVGVAAIAASTVGAGGRGVVGRWPLAVQIVVEVALFDGLWYAYHRAAHRASRLWRVHGAHHSPGQLYVLMHGVFHPIDELVVRFGLALLVFRFCGFAPTATVVAAALIGVVGVVSHANVDLRLGPLNHLLVGPQTHRYHHSADHAVNFGTATTVWDQLFGTFLVAEQPPARLGLADPAAYPDPERFWHVVAWPFTRRVGRGQA